MKGLFKKIVVAVMTLEARAALRRHKPRIVAVTGNVGKTSTKDAVYAVLAHVYGPESVRRSEKSLNSEIGLPLAILGLESAWSSAGGWLRNIVRGWNAAFGAGEFPAWLVLEVGADHPGDIESVSKWLHPDIVVLTRMSGVPVHVEFFKDADEVLREKMFLARALKLGGALVVNADDPYFAKPVKAVDARKVFFGASKGADVEILESEVVYVAAVPGSALHLPIGERAILRIAKGKGKGEGKDAEAKIELKYVIGDHLIYPVAAACAVALALGIPHAATAVSDAFLGFKPPKGRMRVLKGLNSSAIMDDSYNSSPLACAEALKTLGRLSIKGRKIAALADMKELGANAEKAHRDMGALAAETLHTLVTVGDMGRLIAEGARAAGMASDRIISFDTSIEAAGALHDMVRAGDVILVKGSQSMRMERISKVLLAYPERAAELLVRQEKEWLER